MRSVTKVHTQNDWLLSGWTYVSSCRHPARNWPFLSFFFFYLFYSFIIIFLHFVIHSRWAFLSGLVFFRQDSYSDAVFFSLMLSAGAHAWVTFRVPLESGLLVVFKTYLGNLSQLGDDLKICEDSNPHLSRHWSWLPYPLTTDPLPPHSNNTYIALFCSSDMEDGNKKVDIIWLNITTIASF